MRYGKWAALALLAVTQFVLILDLTIVGIAMPPMARDLGLTAADLSWTASAYSLVFGGLLLLGGRLADTLGRRRVFVAGMVLFAAASLLGGVASTGELVIGVRALQGLAGALVAPAALSLVMTIFAGDPAMNKAMGLWGAVGGVGGASGLVLGGVLTDAFGWRSVFSVNVPVAAAVAVLAFVLLPEARGERAEGFDVAGAVISTAGLALLTYGLVDVAESGWGAVWAIGAALVLLGLFLVVEARSAHPLMPLTIFRKRQLRAGNLLTFLVPAAMQPVFFLLTLYTQQVLGYSATGSGLSIVAIAVAIALTASTAGGRAVARYGVRTTAAAGLGFILAGLLLYFRISVDGGFAGVLLAPELLTGVGFGLFVVAATVAATAEASGDEAGLASGLVNVSQQTGISVGMAAVVTTAAAFTPAGGGAAGLVEGYRAGLGVAFATIVVALAVALTMLPRRERAEAALVPAA